MNAFPSLFIFLIRHGESQSNDHNRIQGHSDSGLTTRGLRQAQKTARRLKSMKIQKIYSSDLGRAVTTSQIFAKTLRKKVHKDPLLREIQLGEWEGLTTEDVNLKYELGYERWLESPSKMVIPGAEPIPHFHKRVRTRVDKIMLTEKRGPIAIVTHGGVIASLLAHWLKADFDATLLNLRIDNGSITVVEKNSRRVKIHQLNDISHLAKQDVNHKNIFTNR